MRSPASSSSVSIPDLSMDPASGNPVIRHKYTADPAAIVYNNTVYLYTGHDEAPVGTEDYIMNEWLCFSSVNMIHWNEHEVPLRAADFPWAKGDAYAFTGNL